MSARPGPTSFHLSSLMLVVALLAVCFAVMHADAGRGLLVVMALVSGWFVCFAGLATDRAHDMELYPQLRQTVTLAAVLCVITALAFWLGSADARPDSATTDAMGQSGAVRWAYVALMMLALGTGAVLARRTQQSLGLGGWQRLGIGLGAFCGAMIAAKLPFVLSDWDGLVSGAAWFDNGKTIVFGLVGGYFGVELAKWTMQIRVKTGDSFAVPVAAAVAVGRLACFVGGCCFGTETTLPWGVHFGDGQPRHPTQIYEFIFHMVAACGLAWLGRRRLLREQLIKLYIIVYLAFRFASEFIRPEPVLWFGLTGYQLAALALVPCFVALWVKDRNALESDNVAQSSLPPPLATL